MRWIHILAYVCLLFTLLYACRIRRCVPSRSKAAQECTNSRTVLVSSSSSSSSTKNAPIIIADVPSLEGTSVSSPPQNEDHIQVIERIASPSPSTDDTGDSPVSLASFSMKCINLPQSEDRRRFIERQVGACGFVDKWDWCFEEGIDGSCLPSTVDGTYMLQAGGCWPYIITGSHQADRGVLGCTLSHVKAMHAITTDYCLIIEDDTFLSLCHLTPDFSMDRIVANAPVDWGVLQLGCNKTTSGRYDTWVSSNNMYGTYAYLIRRSCAAAVCSHLIASDGSVHLQQHLSGEKYFNADFFLYGLVNLSTEFTVYTHTVFSTYNNSTTMNSTLHTESTPRHIVTTDCIISDLIRTRSSIGLVPRTLVQVSDTTAVDASLCIPCHFNHLSSLRVLLLSLHLQVCTTNEIVISISSVPMEMTAATLTRALQPLVPSTPVRIFASHELQYAGTNRNICIRNSLYDILIFIDADDLMCSDRVSSVYHIMESRPLLASLLHAYRRPRAVDTRVPYAELSGSTIYDMHLEVIDSEQTIRIPTDTYGLDGYGLKCNGFGIHNGHPVLRRSRLLEPAIWYTDAKRGQDAIFNRTILKRLGRSDDTMLMINVPYTHYCPDSSSTHFVS